jgi:hypothetical protein
MRAGLITLAAALFLFAPGAASGCGAASVRLPILGVVPHAGALRPLGKAATGGPEDLFLSESSCALSNPGFPCWVMATNTTYAIYWIPNGYSVDANYEPLINQYLQDVAAASGSLTNVYSVGMQYYDDTAAIHYQSTFAGSFVDTNPFPASGCNDGSLTDRVCLTDKQIQQEIKKVLAAQGWQGGGSTVFFVMTPEDVGSCIDNVTNQCTTNSYCAYHSGFFAAHNTPVIYANEPYDAAIHGCWDGTSPNGDEADATINSISHEHLEAITDPAGDAWRSWDGNEIGDICARRFGTPLGGTVGVDAYNQLINGHKYWLQEEYSNDGSRCLQHYTPTEVPHNFTQPVLHGVPAKGQLLSTTEGSWLHAPTGFAYQWQRCAASGSGCADISGTTATTYELGAVDVGHTIRVEVKAQNAAGTSAFAASLRTAVVVSSATAHPVATKAPHISGSARIGHRLSASLGLWTQLPTAYQYQWLRCDAHGRSCARIVRAVHSRYRLTKHDAGHRLRVRITAVAVTGSGSATSPATARVPKRKP